MRAGQLGLLLYQGGTVCNEYFNNQSAEAICRQMNLTSAIRWETGRKSDFQYDYEIVMKIGCPDVVWEPKRCLFPHEMYFSDYNRFTCGDHNSDVFLECTGYFNLSFFDQNLRKYIFSSSPLFIFSSSLLLLSSSLQGVVGLLGWCPYLSLCFLVFGYARVVFDWSLK